MGKNEDWFPKEFGNKRWRTGGIQPGWQLDTTGVSGVSASNIVITPTTTATYTAATDLANWQK